ncbi:hypothetical protein J6590_104371 [Homalodisca vitripennis]|nr:hypothetical protein J6590_104371 [Homalodisca vitripennis]
MQKTEDYTTCREDLYNTYPQHHLKVTFEPPPMAGQTDCLQGQDRSAVTHPSSSHAWSRRC